MKKRFTLGCFKCKHCIQQEDGRYICEVTKLEDKTILYPYMTGYCGDGEKK